MGKDLEEDCRGIFRVLLRLSSGQSQENHEESAIRICLIVLTVRPKLYIVFHSSDITMCWNTTRRMNVRLSAYIPYSCLPM
jgi:hypothetical protein